MDLLAASVFITHLKNLRKKDYIVKTDAARNILIFILQNVFRSSKLFMNIVTCSSQFQIKSRNHLQDITAAVAIIYKEVFFIPYYIFTTYDFVYLHLYDIYTFNYSNILFYHLI